MFDSFASAMGGLQDQDRHPETADDTHATVQLAVLMLRRMLYPPHTSCHLWGLEHERCRNLGVWMEAYLQVILHSQSHCFAQ